MERRDRLDHEAQLLSRRNGTAYRVSQTRGNRNEQLCRTSAVDGPIQLAQVAQNAMAKQAGPLLAAIVVEVPHHPNAGQGAPRGQPADERSSLARPVYERGKPRDTAGATNCSCPAL